MNISATLGVTRQCLQPILAYYIQYTTFPYGRIIILSWEQGMTDTDLRLYPQ